MVRSLRTVKKTGDGSPQSRYYLSSAAPTDYTHAQWLQLIRGHWGGVEIRNHWKRDALMGEDRSRTRKPTILANLALLRSACLRLFADHFPGSSLPVIRETLALSTARCLLLVSSS